MYYRLTELEGVDKRKTIWFFFKGLENAIGRKRVNEDELCYVASVLAHYAITSNSGTASGLKSLDLSNICDFFTSNIFGIVSNDSEILEIGGSQVLLLAGFFRDQMSMRHNVKWYDQIGQSFYIKAGECTKNKKKKMLFWNLSQSFPLWTMRCRDLSRELRHSRLVLRYN